MREEEAKDKWCPHAFANSVNGSKCLGSDCMMWREVPPIDERTARLMSQAAVSAASKDGPHGYCGLAGKE